METHPSMKKAFFKRDNEEYTNKYISQISMLIHEQSPWD